jgi:hypothetical protein
MRAHPVFSSCETQDEYFKNFQGFLHIFTAYHYSESLQVEADFARKTISESYDLDSDVLIASWTPVSATHISLAAQARITRSNRAANAQTSNLLEHLLYSHIQLSLRILFSRVCIQILLDLCHS